MKNPDEEFEKSNKELKEKFEKYIKERNRLKNQKCEWCDAKGVAPPLNRFCSDCDQEYMGIVETDVYFELKLLASRMVNK